MENVYTKVKFELVVYSAITNRKKLTKEVNLAELPTIPNIPSNIILDPNSKEYTINKVTLDVPGNRVIIKLGGLQYISGESLEKELELFKENGWMVK